MAGKLSEESSVLIPLHLMQKQGRMGWGISIHQYNSRQEKHQKHFFPWDFQTQWDQTKQNCI